MKGFRVDFTDRADRTLDQLPQESQLGLVSRVSRILTGERRLQGKKLEGYRNVWVVRAGNYRAAYTINEAERSIVIEHIGHRRDFYPGLRRLPHLR